MSISMKKIMAKQMSKGDSSVHLVKVPASRRPTAASLEQMEREISAQISANEAMRSRSMHNAERRTFS